jgi:hypothetical protein
LSVLTIIVTNNPGAKIDALSNLRQSASRIPKSAIPYGGSGFGDGASEGGGVPGVIAGVGASVPEESTVVAVSSGVGIAASFTGV